MNPNLFFFICYTLILPIYGVSFFMYRAKQNAHSALPAPVSWGRVPTFWVGKIDSFIALGFFAYYFLIFIGNWANAPQKPPTQPALTVHLLLLSLIVQALPLLLLFLFLTSRHLAPLREIWRLRHLSFIDLVKAFAFGVIAILCLHLCFSLVQALHWNTFLEHFFKTPLNKQETIAIYQNAHSSPSLRIVLAFSFCVCAPLLEEILFRGYLYPVLKKGIGMPLACLLLSFFFALIHHNILALFPLFILALALVFLYEKTSTLWAPIFLHALFNSATVIALERGFSS